jgi:uncharacterized protein YciI
MARYFAVRRRRGPAWSAALPLRSQPGRVEHASFMNALAAERFVVLGGPLAENEEGEDVLLVIDAPSETAIRTRLAADPWTHSGQLEIVRIEPWTILLDSRPR